MAERAALVFRNGPTTIGTIELDVSITESHTGRVAVTDHPVEDGFNISDHARPEPDRLTIEGLVSNTPLSRTQEKRIVKSMGISLETTSTADQKQGTAGYAEAAFAKLRELKENATLVKILTHIRVYDSMVLEDLNIPRDRSTGDALRFTASFKQVRVVKNKATQKVVSKEPKAQPKVKTGKQTPKPTDEATKKKSIAYKAAETFGLLDKMGIR